MYFEKVNQKNKYGLVTRVEEKQSYTHIAITLQHCYVKIFISR